VIDPDKPLPSTLKRNGVTGHREEGRANASAAKQQEQEKAKMALTNPWLAGMEAEMIECNRQKTPKCEVC